MSPAQLWTRSSWPRQKESWTLCKLPPHWRRVPRPGTTCQETAQGRQYLMMVWIWPHKDGAHTWISLGARRKCLRGKKQAQTAEQPSTKDASLTYRVSSQSPVQPASYLTKCWLHSFDCLPSRSCHPAALFPITAMSSLTRFCAWTAVKYVASNASLQLTHCLTVSRWLNLLQSPVSSLLRGPTVNGAALCWASGDKGFVWQRSLPALECPGFQHAGHKELSGHLLSSDLDTEGKGCPWEAHKSSFKDSLVKQQKKNAWEIRRRRKQNA